LAHGDGRADQLLDPLEHVGVGEQGRGSTRVRCRHGVSVASAARRVAGRWNLWTTRLVGDHISPAAVITHRDFRVTVRNRFGGETLPGAVLTA
jgi:hypothetical protein